MALLNVAFVMGLWLIITTGPCVYFLPKSSKVNIWILQLLLFNNLNLFIALCEIALGKHIKYIKEEYKVKREHYKGKEWEACVAFLTMPLSVSQCFQGKTWSKMWSTYSLYDPSYQNHESFGFFIDVGNGYSTIIPSIFINVAMIYPQSVSHLWVGCVGLASYWQILYGAIIYLVSFWFNERYKGKNFGFVGISNALWLYFPVIGIYCCVCILRDGSMSFFGATST